MPSMTFLLTGRDELSDVFDDIGDAARRLGRRMTIMSIEGDRAVRRFSRNASRDLAALRRDTDAGGKALDQLKKATLLLAPAAIPAAASLAPIAAGAGTVAVAVGVMGAAMIAQVSQISEASEAHKAYREAVDKSGAASQEAVTAQLEYQRLIARMPPETRRAAAAVSVLKDETRAWSNSLAGDTMAPFVKGVALTNALLPKTRDLVRGTSAETDRFLTILGGKMASPGFDAMNDRFTAFSNRTLRSLNTELVGLLRTSQSGEVGQNAKQFMTWARAQGPTVSSVLSNIGTTLIHVLDAGSEVGVGLLDVINVLTKLVSAVPPGAIALFLQLAIALKLTKAAALGMAAARTALAGLGVQLVAMQTAAAAAPGRLAAVTAAIGAMSRGAKLALASTGIGLLVIALTELAAMGQSAPPDVDRLTTSLGELGRTGKATGIVASEFGKDFEKLREQIGKVVDPSVVESINNWGADITGGLLDAGDATEKFTESVDAIDKGLANLVAGGKADLARAALAQMLKGMDPKQAAKFKGELDGYREALATLKFEQQLAAQAQGLFGVQAQKTQAALAAQKASADGLRQSLQALNETQRSALGGMIGFEASIDAAAKAAKENAGSLSMVGGQLDVNSPKAQAAATALNNLASKTEEAAASARESGSSWETVSGIYSRGRGEFIKSARAMGLTKKEAGLLADQILKIPDKKTRIKMDKEDAQKGLEAFNAAVKRTPGSKSVTLKTLSKGAEQILESFGYKVKRLPNGKVTVTAATGGALSGIRNVSGALSSLNGRTANTYVNTFYSYKGKKIAGVSAGRMATGGPVGFPGGGAVFGPGTGTSDSIPAMLSNGEYVINARSTAKHRALVEAINEDRLGSGAGADGAGAAVAAGLAGGMGSGLSMVKGSARRLAAAVIAGMREELQISSPSKKAKALMADLGKGLIAGMTGSRDKIKSTAKDLAADIWKAFDGKKDNRLVAMVNRQTKRLLDLAGQRDKIAAKIKAAKDFAESTRVKAKQDAGLGSMFGGVEEVSAGGIKGKLASRLEKMKQFSRYISELAKRGLNKTMLREILEMGPEQGYAYASALAGADKATFNQINSTQYKINDEAKKLGRKGADALYDSGKNAGRGFLAGLASQQKSIEALMVRIAKGMQKALRKALGIRSPARAMIPDGINTARGVGVGVLQGLPFIDRAMDTMAGRMTGRTGPGFAAVAGRPAVPAGSGVQRVQVDINVSGTSDPVAIARELQRQLLQLKRAHGINVSLGVG